MRVVALESRTSSSHAEALRLWIYVSNSRMTIAISENRCGFRLFGRTAGVYQSLDYCN